MEGAIENCQIQLHHNPKNAQDLFKHLQPQTIQLPPLENGEILIKVLYIALDPSLKPLLVAKNRLSSDNEDNSNATVDPKEIVYDHPNINVTDDKGENLLPNIDITNSQPSRGPPFANYFPPPFVKQQEWIETNHPSIGTGMDPKRIINYGVLKAYAVGEVIESKNHLFTKGRNVYGNLGVQQYLLSNGKDLDDQMVRDITLDSPLSAFLTLSKAGLCAYFGVTELSNVSEGETVFVTGGTGCVGSFVPQIVRASLADKKLREMRKESEEERKHENNHHKTSPSSFEKNSEKTSVCSSSTCLIPHRSCNKAKSPTLSWLFNSLVEQENGEEYAMKDHEDDQYFPHSSYEVISRGDEPALPGHDFHEPTSQHFYSPDDSHHAHRYHHHSHGVHDYHPHIDRLHTSSIHKHVPQIKLYGFCSTESRKSLMINKLKYDDTINYSNYMKNLSGLTKTSTDEPSLNSPVCASCLTPAWSSASPFSHVYGISSSSTIGQSYTDSCSTQREQPADTCILKTGQRYDYSNIDRASLSKAIGEMCPDGIDVVFDTVGGVLLDLCLEHLKMNARIVICGAISNPFNNQEYTDENRESYQNFKFEPPHNYVNLILKCARMEGFMIEKFQSKFKQASHTLVRWIQEKKIDSLEENVIECDLKDRSQVTNSFGKLFSGEYNGKLIIRVKNDHHPMMYSSATTKNP